MEKIAGNEDLIGTLRDLLRDLFAARYRGVAYAKLARAHGYTDGYMQALLQTRVLTQRELRAIVAEEREHIAGPAVGLVGANELVARSA